MGALDQRIIAEASGLAISRRFSDRVYHINDSGSGPYVYITDLAGQLQQRVEIGNFSPRDTEDLALGPCGVGSTCLFVADIGDNFALRSEVEVRAFEEGEVFGQPLRSTRIRLSFPDGPHNAEAFAVYPDGTFVIVTKESTGRGPAPARVYATEPGMGTHHLIQAIQAPHVIHAKREFGPDVLHRLRFVGEIPIPRLLANEKDSYKTVTGMSVSDDGSKFLLLTYGAALEFHFDLRVAPFPRLVEGVNYSRPPIQILPQQEAIAYVPGCQGFMYSTEFDDEAPLMQVLCATSRASGKQKLLQP